MFLFRSGLSLLVVIPVAGIRPCVDLSLSQVYLVSETLVSQAQIPAHLLRIPSALQNIRPIYTYYYYYYYYCSDLIRTPRATAFHSGREADHSPPSRAEIKEWVELYLHSHNTLSWRGAQLGGAQGQLYLLPLPL
jgi:hypothetical protein